MRDAEPLILQPTADGSFTFFSTAFGESFHSYCGARQEAAGKFVQPTQLAAKAATSHSLKLLDVCYGLGYNTAAALETIWRANPDCPVELIALELDPSVPKAAIVQGFLGLWSVPVQQVAAAMASAGKFTDNRLSARLLVGDARQTIQQVYQLGFWADAIFLDPFSPPHCPQLWTVEFLDWLSRCLAATGRLATYSCAAAVRTALQQAGLAVGSTSPVGRRSPGTVASFATADLPGLSLQELEHLQTRAAIPYRDPELKDVAATILHRRQEEQQRCGLESTSGWKHRWGIP